MARRRYPRRRRCHQGRRRRWTSICAVRGFRSASGRTLTLPSPGVPGEGKMRGNFTNDACECGADRAGFEDPLVSDFDNVFAEVALEVGDAADGVCITVRA